MKQMYEAPLVGTISEQEHNILANSQAARTEEAWAILGRLNSNGSAGEFAVVMGEPDHMKRRKPLRYVALAPEHQGDEVMEENYPRLHLPALEEATTTIAEQQAIKMQKAADAGGKGALLNTVVAPKVGKAGSR